MAHDIDLYVSDPDAAHVDLGRFQSRVRIHALGERKTRPNPVIMVREASEELPEVDTTKIEGLESPHEVEVEVVRVGELSAEVIEPLVEAIDLGNHQLSIVQVETVS